MQYNAKQWIGVEVDVEEKRGEVDEGRGREEEDRVI